MDSKRIKPWLGVIAVGVVGVGLLTLGGSGGKHKVAVGRPISISGIDSYDPFGPDKSEHPEDAPKITDGNRATYWSTEQYRDFQKSKPGVGVVLDAQGAVQLSRIIVTTDTPGFTAEVESTNILGSTPQPVSDSDVVGGSTTFDIKSGAPRRYYVIWITKLPPGLDYAHVNEVRAFSKSA